VTSRDGITTGSSQLTLAAASLLLSHAPTWTLPTECLINSSRSIEKVVLKPDS